MIPRLPLLSGWFYAADRLRYARLLTIGKVVRDVITSNLMSTTQDQVDQICPARRSTGFFPGGNGTIPAPRPGLLPGTFIGPTLIFPGVLNPGIPSTIPFANPIHTQFSSQVQINPAPPTGTTTGSTSGGITIT